MPDPPFDEVPASTGPPLIEAEDLIWTLTSFASMPRFNGAASHRGGGQDVTRAPCSRARKTCFNGAASHRGGGPSRSSSRCRTSCRFNGAASHRGGGQSARWIEARRRLGFNGAASHRGGGRPSRVRARARGRASTGPPLIEAEDPTGNGSRSTARSRFNGAASHRGGGPSAAPAPSRCGVGFNGAASHRGGGPENHTPLSVPRDGFNGAASHRGGGLKADNSDLRRRNELQRGRLSSRRTTLVMCIKLASERALQRGRLSSRRRTDHTRQPHRRHFGFNGAASHRGGGRDGDTGKLAESFGLQRGRLSSRRRTASKSATVPSDTRSFNGAASHRGGGLRGLPDAHALLRRASTGPPLIEAEDREEESREGIAGVASTGPPLIEAEDVGGSARPLGVAPSRFNGAASHRGGGRRG